MFESVRAEIRLLSNVADAQGLGRARDLLRLAEHEFAERDESMREMRDEADRLLLEVKPNP
jgi:ribosomal protein S18 acetylase RimI-like enzyme